MPRAELEAWATARGQALDDAAWQRLDQLLGLWQRYGAAFNLVGDPGRPALVEHVREGLMAREVVGRLRRLDAGVLWLDVGSGAGIPGLVIAATTPCHVVLVEPRERRAAFLDLAINTLGRRDSVVMRARIDGSTWSRNPVGEVVRRYESFNRVTSAKAVVEPGQWLDWGRRIVGPDGFVVVHVKEGTENVAGEPPVATSRHEGRVVGAFRGAPGGAEKSEEP